MGGSRNRRGGLNSFVDREALADTGSLGVKLALAMDQDMRGKALTGEGILTPRRMGRHWLDGELVLQYQVLWELSLRPACEQRDGG